MKRYEHTYVVRQPERDSLNRSTRLVALTFRVPVSAALMMNLSTQSYNQTTKTGRTISNY